MTDLKKVVGFYTGEFTTRDTGEKKTYHNLFVFYPRKGVIGIATDVIKVRGQDPFEGIQVGDYVDLFYDRYGNCTVIDPVEPTEADLSDFKSCGDVFAMLDN